MKYHDTGDRHKRARQENTDIGSCKSLTRNKKRWRKCRDSLLDFGYEYFPHWLGRKPSDLILLYVGKLQESVLLSRHLSVAIPRGYAKTTWAKIALVWAAAYRHSDYSTVFGANESSASAILSDVVHEISSNEKLAQDHEGMCRPLADLGGQWQRSRSQHIGGVPTEIKLTSSRLILPTVEGAESSNCVIEARGITSGFLGLNYRGRRPKFALLDDVQGLESSFSPADVRKLESTVQSGVMALGSHERRIGIAMICTVAQEDDLSSRYTDAEIHPEFTPIRCGLVKRWPKRGDLWEQYRLRWKQDQREETQVATEYYQANREAMDDGSVVMDAELYDPRTEVSAIQHAYHARYMMGEKAFFSQMQNHPVKENVLYEITPKAIVSRLNGLERFIMPKMHETITIGSDINHDGIRWVALSIGANGSTAIVDYGKEPETGVLVPPNATEQEQQALIYKGLAKALKRIERAGYQSRDGRGAMVRGWGIDRGYKPEIAHLFARRIKSSFPVIPALGYAGRDYRETTGLVGEAAFQSHMSKSRHGQMLAFNSCAIREICQRAFLSDVLTPGSCCLWGGDQREHYEFAEHICGILLRDKTTSGKGLTYYDWRTKIGAHDDYLDCLKIAFAMAFWFRLISPDAVVMALHRAGARTQEQVQAVLHAAKKAKKKKARVKETRRSKVPIN